jgi:hypothetical protein
MIMRPGQQLLLPANPVFIWFSLIGALALNMLLNMGLFGRAAWVPDLLAVALVFWCVHQPLRIGVGTAFFFGLAMDVHQGACWASTPWPTPPWRSAPWPCTGACCGSGGRSRRCRCCRCSWWPRAADGGPPVGGGFSGGLLAAGPLWPGSPLLAPLLWPNPDDNRAAAGAAAPGGPDPDDNRPTESAHDRNPQRRSRPGPVPTRVLVFGPGGAAVLRADRGPPGVAAGGASTTSSWRRPRATARRCCRWCPTGGRSGPPRRGAGHQLLGLHAGDHAVAGDRPRRPPSRRCGNWSRSRRATSAVSASCSKNRTGSTRCPSAPS